jgi:hypothetical protein
VFILSVAHLVEFLRLETDTADPSGRAVEGVGLRPLAY